MTPISSPTEQNKRHGVILAIIAVTMFSTSPVLVRWAAPLSAYEVTAWRVFIAAVSVGILAFIRREYPRLNRADVPKFILFGLITALHFGTYIASLNFTTIAHSLTIVYTAPVFVTLFSAIFLKEHISARKWLGVAVVIIGIAVLAGFEPNMTPQMWLGDGLALVSAITFGFYSVAGRSQRSHYSLLTYAFFVYLLAAVWMAPAAALTFTPSGYGWRQIASVVALGVIPLGLGHTLYNGAVRRMHATYANLIASQEVTGGIILGILFLHEIPGVSAITGVVITLLGIVMVLV